MQGDKKLDLATSHLVEGKVAVEQIKGLCQALGYFPAGTHSCAHCLMSLQMHELAQCARYSVHTKDRQLPHETI